MEQTNNPLDRFAIGLTIWVLKLRWLVILLALGGTFYMASGAQNLKYSSNYRTFFSKENPELKNFEDFQATYVKSDNFIFLVVPKGETGVFTNKTTKMLAEMTEAAWLLPYATRVDSLTNFQHSYGIEDELIVEDLIPAPGDMTAAALEQKQKIALAEPLLNGQLISTNADATAINVVLNYPEKALTEVPEAVAAARALRAGILQQYPDYDIYISGTSMLNNAFSEAVVSDFKTLIPFMLLVILLTTAFSVRSISATLVTITMVAMSASAAMGWAGFVGIELAGPSPSATIIILTLAIADSIHILLSIRAAMRRGLEKRDAIIDGMRVNFLAVTITSITTIVGFMALNFSDSPPFRDLGNISAVGIGFAWAFSLTFLPAMISIVPFRADFKAETSTPSRLYRFGDFVVARHRSLFILSGAAAIALIAFIPKNVLSDNTREYFDDRIEFRADTDKLIEYFGFGSIEFSVVSGEAGGIYDPEFQTTLEAFTQWLRDQDKIAHVYSLSDIMKRLNKNLHGDDPAWYKVPDERQFTAQYLLLFELSLPYGLDLNDRVNIDKSATRITAALSGNATSADTRELLKNSKAWFEQHGSAYHASGTGPQVMFTFIAQRNVESMIKGTLIAIGIIAVIMVLALRSLPIGLLSIVPNGLPVLTAFGAWGLLVGEVGFSVAAVASLSLGIIIDDTVHFLTKYIRARKQGGLSAEDSIRYAFDTVGGAILVNTFILVAGFATLTFSAFRINAELGLLTCLSIGFALILDFLFLPGLLLFAERRRSSDTNPVLKETSL